MKKQLTSMYRTNNSKIKGALVTFSILMSSFVLFSCGTSEEYSEENDPEGTVAFSIVSPEEGIGMIYVENGLFKGEDVIFVSVGKVKGIGNITSIPKDGWTSRVFVVEGEGYVVYAGGASTFFRMHVSSYTDPIVRGKIQAPFIGSEKEILPETNTLFFDKDSERKNMIFLNKSMFPFSVSAPDSSKNWLSTNSLYRSRANASPPYPVIWVEENPNIESRKSAITIKSDIGESVEVEIIQSGRTP
ncbi:MAG: hypothetical protein LBI60_02630 [Bacteroidales bacterium]|jgi:hypothetical protein|nr:hypothetical protein [Bacteroidales bacterium]